MSKRGGGQVISWTREASYNMGLPFCDVSLYRVRGKRRQRRALGKPTSAAQERVNRRNAILRLERMINHNFEDGVDYFTTLTFDEEHKPETRADAKRITVNFLRRVKRAFEKVSERPFKWIYVIEGEDGKRFHVHLVMTGGLPEARIREIWGMAYIVNVKILQAEGKGYEALANYLTKQGKLAGEHRWCGSRNLDKPEYAERNARISAEDTEALAKEIEDINAGVGLGVKTIAERYAPVEERYPGYYMADAEAIYIEQFREWVIHIKLYHRDSEPGRRETKRRRAEERAFRMGKMAAGLEGR